jgi:alkylhydroperoxidase/carboxymuconolactone decarboxylase family protein YurZ
MKAFWQLNDAAFGDGTLSGHMKQLISVAVALATQCPRCIEFHTKAP